MDPKKVKTIAIFGVALIIAAGAFVGNRRYKAGYKKGFYAGFNRAIEISRVDTQVQQGIDLRHEETKMRFDDLEDRVRRAEVFRIMSSITKTNPLFSPILVHPRAMII